MTDNRTTETATSRIIATLRERNVQFATHGNTDRVWWKTENGLIWYAQDRPNANELFVKLEAVLTPEQAIVATLGSGKAKDLLLRTFGLAQMMYDCWLEECKAGDNVDVSACNAYSYEFDQIAQAMFDMGIDPNDSDYYRSAELGSGTCEQVLTDCDDGLMPPFMAHCSACGAEWGFTPKYCYNCGAKCTGTRDERKAVER